MVVPFFKEGGWRLGLKLIAAICECTCRCLELRFGYQKIDVGHGAKARIAIPRVHEHDTFERYMADTALSERLGRCSVGAPSSQIERQGVQVLLVQWMAYRREAFGQERLRGGPVVEQGADAVPTGKSQELARIARDAMQLAVKLLLIGGRPCHASARAQQSDFRRSGVLRGAAHDHTHQ